ncbi:MAG: calcium-binding protein [Pseudomonadota bacterium]
MNDLPNQVEFDEDSMPTLNGDGSDRRTNEIIEVSTGALFNNQRAELLFTELPTNGTVLVHTLNSGGPQTLTTNPIVLDPFDTVQILFQPDPDFAGDAGRLVGVYNDPVISGSQNFSVDVSVDGINGDDPTSLFVQTPFGTAIPEESAGGLYFDPNFVDIPEDTRETWFAVLRGVDPDITYASGHDIDDFLTFTIIDPVSPFEIIVLDFGTVDRTDDVSLLALKLDSVLDFESQQEVSVNIRVDDNQPGANSGILDREFTFTVDNRPEVIEVGTSDSALLAYDVATNGSDLIYGFDAADSIAGGDGADIILGGRNNDTLSGQDDQDAIAGEAGNDEINGDDGADFLDGGEGSDLIYGGSSDDRAFGGPGNDSVYGGPQNDQLFGGSSSDWLEGDDGNDTLDGGSSSDVMFGGQGDDVYFVDLFSNIPNAPSDFVFEFIDQGYDRVFSSVNIELSNHVEAGNLTGTSDLVMIAAATGSWIQGNVGNNFMIGSGVDDRLDGNAGDDTLFGAEGNDILEGGSGVDTFAASEGTDVILDFVDGEDIIDLTLLFLDFNDLVAQQLGQDVSLNHAFGTLIVKNADIGDITASDFNESAMPSPRSVEGGDTDDILSEAFGPVEISGFGGNDLLRVLDGVGTLIGGTGDDRYYVYDEGTVITELADEGTDVVYTRIDLTLSDNVENAATNNEDQIDLTGNVLDNALTGNGNANTLTGLDGNDRLIGRAGDDELDGGLGNDYMLGGAGADVFVFDIVDHGVDRIGDFEVGVDRIDYRGTGLTFADLEITGVTTGVVSSAIGTILVNDVSAGELSEDSFLFG